MGTGVNFFIPHFLLTHSVLFGLINLKKKRKVTGIYWSNEDEAGHECSGFHFAKNKWVFILLHAIFGNKIRKSLCHFGQRTLEPVSTSLNRFCWVQRRKEILFGVHFLKFKSRSRRKWTIVKTLSSVSIEFKKSFLPLFFSSRELRRTFPQSVTSLGQKNYFQLETIFPVLN